MTKRKKYNNKKKKSPVPSQPHRAPPPPPPMARRARLFDVQACDLLSMLLVRWSLARLLAFARLLLAVLLHRDELAMTTDEDEPLLVESATSGEVLFTRLFSDLIECAASSTEAGQSPQHEAAQHYRALLRGCCLVALHCEARARRFCLARHTVLQRAGLACTRPEVWQWHGFMAAVAGPAVDTFVARALPLRAVAEHCVERWRRDYMFRAPPFVATTTSTEETYHHLVADKEGRGEGDEVAVLAGGGVYSDKEIIDCLW